MTSAKLTALVEASCGSPCPVTVTGDELGEVQSAELASHIDASGQALKTALYLMLGTAVGGFIAYVLVAAVRKGGG